MKSLYNTIFKEKWNVYTAVTVFSLLLAIFQFCAIVYTNIFQIQYHLDADASINFLSIQELSQPLGNNSGVSSITGTGHSLFKYIYVVLYRLTGSIFMCYGIYNIIITCAVCALLVFILKKLKTGTLAILLCLNLLLCPYIANDMSASNYLGYFHLMFTSSGYYGTRTVIELLIILNVLNAEEQKLNVPLIIITGIGIFSYGMSTGLYLLQTILGPMIVFCVVMVFVKNDIHRFFGKTSIIVFAGTAILLAGKYFIKKVYGQTAIDSDIVFISIQNLWQNICSVFYGYMHIFGAIPQTEGQIVLSVYGASYMIALLIFIINVTALSYYIVRLIKKDERAIKFLPFFIVMLFVFAVQSLVKSPFEHESQMRGERYLLPVMISGIFIVGFFVDNLDSNRLFKKAGTAFMALCIAFSTVFSYKIYSEHKTPYDICVNIAQQASKYEEAPVVYSWGREYTGPLSTWGIAYNLRTIDRSKVYKALSYEYNYISNGGDYSYFDDNSEWRGETLILSTPDDFEQLPVFIKQKYILVYREPSCNLGLYYSENTNCFDLTSAVKIGTNIDFPYSEGVSLSNGDLDERGIFTTNGTAGVCLFGSASHTNAISQELQPSTEAGKYSITIEYNIKQCGNRPPVLYASTESSDLQIGFDEHAKSITLENVVVPYDDSALYYSVDVGEGTILEIKSIIINSV